MNFLEIVQKTSRECQIPGVGPSAVTSQTGEALQLVDWVYDAWLEIQNRHVNWRWMRSTFFFNTVADQQEYAFTDCTDEVTTNTIDRFARWWITSIEDPAKIYLLATGVGGQHWLSPSPWDAFKAVYKIGSQNSSLPAHVAITPADKIALGPAPNDIYRVIGDYQKSPQLLAADGDTPDMPSQYHNLIVYRAMEKYAYFESAAEILARAEKEGNRLMRQVEKQPVTKIQAWPCTGMKEARVFLNYRNHNLTIFLSGLALTWLHRLFKRYLVHAVKRRTMRLTLLRDISVSRDMNDSTVKLNRLMHSTPPLMSQFPEAYQ